MTLIPERTANLLPERNALGSHDRAFYRPKVPGRLIRCTECSRFMTADYAEDPRQACPHCKHKFTRKMDWARMYVESEVNQAIHGSWTPAMRDILSEHDKPAFIGRDLTVRPLNDVALQFAKLKIAGERNIMRLRSQSSVSQAVGGAVQARRIG